MAVRTVGARTHERVPVSDIEMGTGGVSPVGIGLEEAEKKEEKVSSKTETPAEGCCQKCCHSVKPRDWSEYLIVPGGLTSFGFGVFHAFQDSNAWVAAPSFAVSLICALAEVRVRQLWIKKTLDDEAQDFRAANATLRGRVEALETSEKEFKAENAELKENVEAFGQDNAQFKEQTEKLQEDLAAERKVRAELEENRATLERDIALLREAARETGEAVDGGETGGKGGDDTALSDLERQLSDLRRAGAAQKNIFDTIRGTNE